MAYSGTTAASSAANPPILWAMSGIGRINSTNGAVAGTSGVNYGTSLSYVANRDIAGGCRIWAYYSTDPTSYIYGTGGSAYFTDGHQLGFRQGDIIFCISSTAYASTVGVNVGIAALLTTNSTAGWGLSDTQILSTS